MEKVSRKHALKTGDIPLFKACVHYVLTNFSFSVNDSPSKSMKDVFYFILKALFVLKTFPFFLSVT